MIRRPRCDAQACAHPARWRVRFHRRDRGTVDLQLCGKHSRPFRLCRQNDVWTVLDCAALTFTGAWS